MSPNNKFLIPILLLLVIMPMLATDIYLPAIPAINEEFEGGAFAATDTLTSYMLGYSVSLLSAGVLADIYGRRTISIAGTLLFSIASLGCFLASSIEGLMAWRFLQALGGGCGTLIARIVVRDSYPLMSQVKILSYLASGLVISPIVGPIVGAHISSYFGWRGIFLYLAIFSFSGLILLWIFMKETLKECEKKSPYTFSSIFSEYLTLMRDREFAFHTLIISLAWGVYFTFLSSSPILIQKIYSITPVVYSYIFSLTISGFILGTIFIRLTIGSLDLRNLIFIAGCIILISTIAIFVLSAFDVRSLPLLLFFIFCSLFGIGVIFPATQAGVTQSFKRNIGLLSGLFYSIEMLFGAICSYILSIFGSATWIVTSALMVALAFCIVLLTISDKCFSLYFQSKKFKNI